jgi:hypothetical protein
MRSRLEVRMHVNRALRARSVERKLDAIALAIAELARYIEELEKDKLKQAATR